MLGRLDPTQKNAAIIGGGISGLLIAHTLVQQGYTIDLFEKTDRLGGLIATRQTPHGLVETALNAVPATAHVRSLFEDLSLEYLRVPSDTGKGLIWRDGRMRAFPLTFFETLDLLWRASTKKSDGKEISLSEWAQHHLGKAADTFLMGPVASGIYATHPASLHLMAAFPSLAIPAGQTLLRHGLSSYHKRERRVLVTPKDGMQALVDALVKSLSASGKAAIHLSTEVQTFPNSPNVIACVPGHAIGGLFPDLAADAAAIRYNSLVTATVFIRKTYLPDLPRSFGVLLPPLYQDPVLGIIFNSMLFPFRVSNDDHYSLTFILGGQNFPELAMADDELIQTHIDKALQDILQAQGGATHYSITSWPQALPLYDNNLVRFWQRAQEKLAPGRVLFGNYTGAISLRGIIDSIRKV
jgi:protoporphyrinogen/coproporphyrinogen III oxidase